MSIPASLTAVTVTARYVKADGSAASGLVRFQLSAPAAVPADKAMVPLTSVKATLDAAGSISVVLAASDDPDWAVSGLTYQVTERITGAELRTYNINVPANTPGGTVDLASLAPVVPGPTVVVAYVLAAAVGAVGGPAGPLDATGKVPASQVPASASPVQSVAGKTGEVVLAAGDVAGVETPDGAQDKADAAQAAAIADAAGKYAPVFSVAAPTGVAATDTAAIQDAIAATATFAYSGVVQLRAGVYAVNAPLTINPYRCSLVGAGPQHTAIEFSGLAVGQYAITFAINNGAEPAAKQLPFVGARDLTIRQATPYTAAWHGIRMGTDAVGIDGYGVTFDRVKIEGFGDQVTYLSRSYLSSWANCNLYAAQSRGVVLPTATTAGERITFTSCVFDQSPGTLIEISGTGTDAYFYGCSFDYSGRALNISGGQAQFFGCHFETDNARQGSFHEYILINRNGSNPLPQVLISGGMFFPWWTTYDTAIRVTGTTFGEAILQVRDLRVFSDPTTTCPYLIRDDGPTPANIAYSGIVFSDTTVMMPKYRDQGGVDNPITHLGGMATAKSARPLRRTNVTAVEPIPAAQVSASGAVTSGTIYHVYFRPTEDITLTKVALFIAGTVAAGNTLSKVAVYESGAGGALTLRAQSSGAAFGANAFSRAEVALTSGWTCRAGKIYTLSVLFVGGVMPAIATIPTVGGYLLTNGAYGHPICHQTTGQTDMPASIVAGSLGGGSLLPYLVGSAV